MDKEVGVNRQNEGNDHDTSENLGDALQELLRLAERRNVVDDEKDITRLIYLLEIFTFGGDAPTFVRLGKSKVR